MFTLLLLLLNLILLLLAGQSGPGGLARNAFALFARAAQVESTIEVRRFFVPGQAYANQQIRLQCLYELHGASLHAMKLFKDEREFYRFAPGNPPGEQKMAFPNPGVQAVDLARSNERDVWLRTNKRSSGSYKCQVTIEGKFISVSAEKRLEVVAAPADSSWSRKTPGELANQARLPGGSLGRGPARSDHVMSAAASNAAGRAAPSGPRAVLLATVAAVAMLAATI